MKVHRVKNVRFKLKMLMRKLMWFRRAVLFPTLLDYITIMSKLHFVIQISMLIITCLSQNLLINHYWKNLFKLMYLILVTLVVTSLSTQTLALQSWTWLQFASQKHFLDIAISSDFSANVILCVCVNAECWLFLYFPYQYEDIFY